MASDLDPIAAPAPVAEPANSPASSGGIAAPTPEGAPSRPASPPAPPSLSWREHLHKNAGVDLSGFQDDGQAAAYLAQALNTAKNSQPYARMGQEMAPHWDQFQDYLKAQAKQQPAQEKQPWWGSYWKPPEYDPQWEKLLTQDESGRVVASPGAPPGLAEKYGQYKLFRQQQAEKLMQNPYQYFEEPIKTLARQVAEEEMQKHLGTFKEQGQAKEFITQNTSWLHQYDPQNTVVRDPVSGDPLLSQWGQKFQGYVVEAQDKFGLETVQRQQEFAMLRVRLDRAMEMLGEKNAAQPPVAPAAPITREEANAQVLAKGKRPSPSHALPPANHNGLSLQERLRKNLKASGVKDEDMATFTG